MGRNRLLLKLELCSNAEILSVVRQALGQLAEIEGFSSAESRAMVLAVDEALTNIIRHAYSGEGGRPIELSFRRIEIPRDGIQRKALEIVLEDRGRKIDRATLCGRSLEEVRPGGLGLHFINECMDTVEFRRKAGKNQLRLIKMRDVAKLGTGA